MKKKILIIVIFLITMIITSIASAYAANYLYNSNEVYYDNTNSNLTSSDVQGSIDELYIIANEKSEVLKYAFGDPANDTTTIYKDYMDLVDLNKNIFVSLKDDQYSACIYKNGSLACFKINNYNNELQHVQQVFSDGACVYYYNNTLYECSSDEGIVDIYTNGTVSIRNSSGNQTCHINSDKSMVCIQS